MNIEYSPICDDSHLADIAQNNNHWIRGDELYSILKVTMPKYRLHIKCEKIRYWIQHSWILMHQEIRGAVDDLPNLPNSPKLWKDWWEWRAHLSWFVNGGRFDARGRLTPRDKASDLMLAAVFSSLGGAQRPTVSLHNTVWSFSALIGLLATPRLWPRTKAANLGIFKKNYLKNFNKSASYHSEVCSL